MNEDKSSRYHRLRRRADLLGTAVAGVLLLSLLLLGGATRLRELAAMVAQRGPGGAEDALTVIVMTVALIAILQIIELPFAFYQGHLLEHHYGLSTQSTAHWFVDHGKGVAVGIVLAAAGTSVVYFALRLAPDDWWWISAAVFALATVALARIAPVLLLPIFYKFKPLDRPALVDRLMGLATKARTDVVGVFEWVLSGHTRKANAALAGMGRTRRILLSDTLLADFSEDEIEVILAHELAHHVYHDIWTGLAVQGMLMTAALYAADRVLALAVGPLNFDGKADVAALPLVALTGGAVSLLLQPVANAVSRAHERRADRYALEMTRNASAFVSAMKRLGALNLADDRPSSVLERVFHTHPPVSARISAAQAWAAGKR